MARPQLPGRILRTLSEERMKLLKGIVRELSEQARWLVDD
jgi:cell division inhibitor SulA